MATGCRPPEKPPVVVEPTLHAQIPGRDLRKAPLQLKSLTVAPLDGQVLVEAVPAEQEKRAVAALEGHLNVFLEEDELELNDLGQNGDRRAGDGTFSGRTKLDLPKAEQLKQLEGAELPVFQGRELKQMKKLDPELIARILGRKPFDLSDLDIFGKTIPVDSARSLMITDLGVVEDGTRTFNPCTRAGNPNGVWTFGHLMRQLANQPLTGISGEALTLRWLRRWDNPQVINDFLVPPRDMRGRITDPWLAGGATLDLTRAPFRLLAIVNRVDLRDNLVYGTGSAGEARFVFGALDPASCSPLPFTVIFEYGIEQRGCRGLKAWAQQWADLATHPVGSPSYNAALQAITDQFTAAGAAPSRPNGSALNQLRTNEIALADPWELREFRIFDTDSDAHHLRMVTVKQTPNSGPNLGSPLDRTQVLADYVNANTPSILAQTHVVPLDFPAASPFLGGSALTPGGDFWRDATAFPIANRDARHLFSLNTCDGCHAGETQTPFVHVGFAPFGAPAPLSGFLTGISVADPADGAPTRTFNDLARRATDMSTLLAQSCLREFSRRKLFMVH